MRAAATVGRGPELAEIDAFLLSLSAGGGLLSIEGEPGIGKTTLLADATERARSRSIRVLACRPAASEAKMAFAGLTDMLAPIGEGELDPLPDRQRRALEIALGRVEPEAGPFDPQLLGSGLLLLLRALADRGPVLLAVDDAQWLDEPTRRLLPYAVRRLGECRLGLLCSSRLGALPPELADLLRQFEPGGARRLRVGPMEALPLRRLIGERLGRPPSPPVAARITAAARGNPFYALEVARLLPADPGAADRLPVPDDVRSLARARMVQLPAQTRETLLLATVLAVPEVRLLDAAALAPAEQTDLVHVDSRGRVQFAHPLFATAVYADATEAQRRAAHRCAAELVGEPEQRALHLAHGAARPDPAIAAELEAAAGFARLRGSPAAAAELSELSRQMTAARDGEGRARRTLTAASLRVAAQDLPRARALLDELLAGPAPSLIRARGLRLRAEVEAQNEGFARALRSVQEGLRAAEGRPDLQAALDLDAAFYLVGMGEIPAALGHAESAIGRAELPGGDTGLLGDALAVVTMVSFLAGEGLHIGRLDRALALEDPERDRFLVTSPRYIAGLLELWTGRLREAVATLSSLRTERLERGVEGDVSAFSLYLVWAHLWLGEADRAAELAEADAALVTLLGDRGHGLTLTLCAEALVAAHRGELPRTRERSAAALALMEALGTRSHTVWPRWALGVAELTAGDPAAAHEAMEPLLGMLPAIGLADPIGFMFLPDEVEALILLGDLARAESLVELLHRLAEHHDRAWALAGAERGRGLLAAARGETDAAIAHLEAALVQHARVEMPVERARTLLALGRARRRRKRWASSRDAFREALAVFEATGAIPWARAARDELGRAGEPAAEPDELTPTERRVAELAAAGLSNQAVADRAFLTVKGVEGNLTRVYRKLGIRSRRELAGALGAGHDAAARPSEPRRQTVVLR